MGMSDEILNAYLEGQKELIEFEDLDGDNCLVSLPRHFSAHTRVDLTASCFSEDQFVLTDQRQTISELRDAGVPVGPTVLERLKQIIRVWEIDLVGVNLIVTCRRHEL